jgi:hypothetical protein
VWRNIKGILVLVGLAFLGGSYLFTRLFGSGSLHVLTVGPGGGNVSVDGTPTLEQTQDEDHFAFKLSQGNHEVTVTDPGTGKAITYSVNISDGFTEVLLPVRADQCFVRFDMTDAAYSSSRNKEKPPPVSGQYKNKGEPITLPSSTYFTFDEMPKKRRNKESVYMLRDVPCSLLTPGTKDELLLVALSSQADELFTNLDAIVNSQE